MHFDTASSHAVAGLTKWESDLSKVKCYLHSFESSTVPIGINNLKCKGSNFLSRCIVADSNTWGLYLTLPKRYFFFRVSHSLSDKNRIVGKLLWRQRRAYDSTWSFLILSFLLRVTQATETKLDTVIDVLNCGNWTIIWGFYAADHWEDYQDRYWIFILYLLQIQRNFHFRSFSFNYLLSSWMFLFGFCFLWSFSEMDRGRGVSSQTVPSRIQMRDLNKRFLVLFLIILIILDTAEFSASLRPRSLIILRLLPWTKVCFCDVAASLVEIFKEKSEKRNENQSLVSIFEISECPVLREIGTKQSLRVVRNALPAHFLRGIDRLFHHI